MTVRVTVPHGEITIPGCTEIIERGEDVFFRRGVKPQLRYLRSEIRNMRIEVEQA